MAIDIDLNGRIEEVVNLIKSQNNILIITHKNPDGDAIGSSFGLYHALKKIGKRVAVDVGDEIPDIYKFMFKDYYKPDFKPSFIISVDLADTKLLFEYLKKYENKIDLSIDHHMSNTFYAGYTLVNSESAATAQILYYIIKKLIGYNGIDNIIASCLYLGLTTDTGCFKYSSVTEITHKVAAALIERGADYFNVNKRMFDTKSKQKIQLEQNVLANIEYYFNDQCALIYISKLDKEKFQVKDYELEGISALPTQIDGVEIGITVKQQTDNEFKISIRTNEKYNASEICEHFGGGGHKRAGGCLIKGTYENVLDELLSFISKIYIR